MKEKLSAALGVFGFILYYVILWLCAFSPLLVLGFSIWIDIIIILFVSWSRFFGGIICLGLYVWAFIVVISQPINIISIIFFISAALYIFLFVLPSTLRIFSKDDE